MLGVAAGCLAVFRDDAVDGFYGYARYFLVGYLEFGVARCNAEPGLGDVGLGEDALLIDPGNSANSVVLERMSRRDAQGMPPVGSHIYDVEGAVLLGMWIDSLESCVSPAP